MRVATAKTDTLLPLDTFAKIVGIHPMHFNQVYIGSELPCGVVWMQYNWQSQTSREQVARAIRKAEDALERFLGFPVAPKWFSDLQVPLKPDQSGLVTLPKAYYITGGRKASTLIQAGVTVNYDSEYGSDYHERATIVCPTSLTDASEIAICYPDESLDDWQVKPIKVTISAGNATIICERHQLVEKAELEKFDAQSVIGTEDKFLSEVDVYRIYNDPATQVLIHSLDPCGSCYGNGCNACHFSIDTGCTRDVDSKYGIVEITPATWDSDAQDFNYTCCLTGRPYNSRHYFKAGWPLQNGEMDDLWAQAVVKLAIAFLENALCPCPSVKATMEFWSEELGKNNRERTYKIPEALKNCPWGYSRGALYAYAVAINHKMAQGTKSS